MKDANDQFAKFKTKVDERRIKALTSAVKAVSEPDDKTMEAARSAIASYIGSRDHLEKGYDEHGNLIPPDPNRPYRGALFLATLNQDPGFRVEAFYIVNQDRFIAYQSMTCSTASEATQQVRDWAKENHRHLVFPQKRYFKGDIKYEDDCLNKNDLWLDAQSSLQALVIAGSRLKAESDEITVLLEKAQKPLAAYYDHKLVFGKRWNAEGKWIGPVAKPKKDKKKTTETLTEPSVAEITQDAVAN